MKYIFKPLGYVLISLIVGTIPKIALSQSIEGHIYEFNTSKSKTPVAGAFIHCLGESDGVFSDSLGYFKIEGCNSALEIQHISLLPDTIFIVKGKSKYEVVLQNSGTTLEPTVVERKKQNQGLRNLDPKTTVNLGEREFQKAACCNLSESFENSPAIDVSFGDAVTGTKQIKMLGLDGFYSMISREYMPGVRLMNSYYGMSFIPAAWVNGIQITKGVGSVVNGFESMAGQINVELKKPFDHNRFMLDQFISESGRAETDVMYRHDINKHLATSFFVRSAFVPFRMDRNGDGFQDNPTGQQFQAMNRWQYQGKKWEGQLSAVINTDVKEAGQLDFYEAPATDKYGINIQNDQIDIWAKLGRVFPEVPYRSFGSQYSYSRSNQTSKYGSAENPMVYTARSQSFYGNLMYQSIFGTTEHTFQTGVSFIADDVDERIELVDGNELKYSRKELVPGTFLEYTFKPTDKMILVSGIRADWNSIFGFSVTPRFHGKFSLNKGKTNLRISGGMGRRTPNIFSQNQQAFASSRQLELINNEPGSIGVYNGLKQEVSLNAGFSLEHKMKWGLWPATLMVDYFRTNFLQEVVFDRETDSLVRFYNIPNGTYANSFQSQLEVNLFRRTEVRLAYRMFDVSTLYSSGRLQKPFVARHRGFLNVTQSTRSKWQMSSTLQVYGKQRIPGVDRLQGTTDMVEKKRYSPSFVQLNLQVSKEFNTDFEGYLGVENLLNYKQENPILGADKPFDQSFDASLVWGPVFGRMFYGGIRWRIMGSNLSSYE